jgi:hypothetical protein
MPEPFQIALELLVTSYKALQNPKLSQLGEIGVLVSPKNMIIPVEFAVSLLRAQPKTPNHANTLLRIFHQPLRLSAFSSSSSNKGPDSDDHAHNSLNRMRAAALLANIDRRLGRKLTDDEFVQKQWLALLRLEAFRASARLFNEKKNIIVKNKQILAQALNSLPLAHSVESSAEISLENTCLAAPVSLNSPFNFSADSRKICLRCFLDNYYAINHQLDYVINLRDDIAFSLPSDYLALLGRLHATSEIESLCRSLLESYKSLQPAVEIAIFSSFIKSGNFEKALNYLRTMIHRPRHHHLSNSDPSCLKPDVIACCILRFAVAVPFDWLTRALLLIIRENVLLQIDCASLTKLLRTLSTHKSVFLKFVSAEEKQIFLKKDVEDSLKILDSCISQHKVSDNYGT